VIRNLPPSQKKTRLHFLRKCNHFLRKSFSKKMRLSKKMAFSKKYFRKNVQFPQEQPAIPSSMALKEIDGGMSTLLL
jgi:hypothetical protein